jgi:ligand-binding sensor domain-containing protein/signal transduction histidine kinase/DNA-binding response OmpR family regulator
LDILFNMYKHLAQLVLLFLACHVSEIKAQSYYFRNYQTKEGLSSNTITCIAQDNTGFMWFGTRNGLNKFDGMVFKVFKNDSNDPFSIGSNSILCLHEDSYKNLWIGTYKGVYVYDAIHERFIFFNKLPTSEVRSINSDKSGNVWLVIGYNLYKYNLAEKNITRFAVSKNQIPAICIDNNNTIWLGTDSGAIKKYDIVKNRFIDYASLLTILKKEIPFIQSIYPSNDSTLLIATLHQFFSFNVKSLKSYNIFKGTTWENNIQVHKIIRQSASSFWIGTENGIYIIDTKKNTTEIVQKQYANPYSLSDNVITDFCTDKEGNTWIGTFFGGINYYSNQLNQFRKYFPLPETNSLSGNLVHEICTDKYENIWVGTEDGGLNKIDKTTGIIKHFMPGKGLGSIAYQNIHGLLADDNELWIGTYEHGLDVMDLRTEKVIRHYEKSNLPNSLNSNFIVSIFKNKAGQILVGTWAALFVFDREHNNFKSIPFFNRQAQAMLEDYEGTLWVCSYGNGIYFYNPLTGKRGSINYDPSSKNSLPNNYVNNLFEDHNHNIWFCTESGLCELDMATKKIKKYSNDPILGSNQIFRILEDKKGVLWISTSKGLVSLNLVKNETNVYTINHGLLSEQFNYNSAYKDKNGKLYFGTTKGMISFEPDLLQKDNYIPPVFITELQVNNKPLSLNSSNARSAQAIPFSTGITLPYDSSNISIEVAALSYSIPNMNGYAYKMDGLEKEWTFIKSNRKIYYTKLPPGHYTFRIKGSNSSGIWNKQEKILNINILPPLWASTWAYTLYTFLILGIIFTILRYYYIALREKNQRKLKVFEIEKEREIYNAKIEFFTNVTHEIRTPLTLIKLPVEKLLKTVDTDSSILESLIMIDNNTNRLINLTNQLLDFRKAEANNYSLSFVRTNINELLKELWVTYQLAAEKKSISFKLETPKMPLLAFVDPEAFRKLLNNLFNNAIKYAELLVTVKLMPFSSDDTSFKIEFKNDGYIIPPEMKEKIFEPFYRLKQTEKYSGTGIGLSLARSLAELHKGYLELKDPDNNCNTFLLSIPIHQETEIDMGEETLADTPVSNISKDSINETPMIVDVNKISILLVEDDKEIINFLQKELTNDYNIFKAFNGQEALDKLSTENINLVISDIMMPIMDGTELCKKMKTDLHFSHIPIILLTAKNTLTSKIEGLETGADAYIEKPFVMKYLLAQITNLLSNRNIIKEYYAHSPLAHIKGIACSNADKKFLEELQSGIDANITEKDLDVDTLAKMMNMSRGTFYRKIKGISDLTPNELITLSRLKKAAELLANSNYKINEVANMVGYSLLSNFSRDFHKQFGISPSNYIKNLEQENK